jgi:hypothetical protein
MNTKKKEKEKEKENFIQFLDSQSGFWYFSVRHSNSQSDFDLSNPAFFSIFLVWFVGNGCV